MLFCCGRDGTSLDPDVPGTDLIPLFDTLLSNHSRPRRPTGSLPDAAGVLW